MNNFSKILLTNLLLILTIPAQALIETTKTTTTTTVTTVVSEEVKPKLSLKATTIKQGDYIYATVTGLKDSPKIWFNSREFRMFEIPCADKEAISKQKTFRALLPVENLTKPGAYSVLARSGDWEQRIPVTIKDNAKPISKIWTKGPDIVPTEKELNLIGSALGTKSAEKLWVGKFAYPSLARKSSPFGVKRSYNGKPVDSYHKGLDFAAATGSAVFAPAEGKVILTGQVKDGFKLHGNTVMLDHGQGVVTIYMHLSKILVKEGDIVTKGQKLGEVGSTGIATGPHLHWGLYLYGTSTEPENFIKEELI